MSKTVELLYALVLFTLSMVAGQSKDGTTFSIVLGTLSVVVVVHVFIRFLNEEM